MATDQKKFAEPFSRILRVAIILGFFSIATDPLLALPPDESGRSPQQSDSTQILRRQYAEKKLWENLISLPGTVISLPLVLFLKLQEELVGYIYANKLIPKTRQFFTSADERRGIVPKFSNRSGGGVKFFQDGILNPASRLTLTATGNLGKRQRYRFEWKRVNLWKGTLSAEVRLRYRFLPGESFFGMGPQTEESDITSYDHEYTTGDIRLNVDASPALSFFAQARFDHNNVYAGSDSEPPITIRYDAATLAGLQSKVRIAQYQAGIVYDSRNRPGNPSGGYELSASGTLFQDIDGGPFSFWKANLNLFRYFHFAYNRVLMVRLSGGMTEPLQAGDLVPFYYLSEIGHRETVRGFDRGRFRDLDVILATLEYRIPLWHSLDFFGFIDGGQVAENIGEDFRTNRLQFGYGAGVRLFNTKELVAVVQLAVSRERVRVYLNLN